MTCGFAGSSRLGAGALLCSGGFCLGFGEKVLVVGSFGRLSRGYPAFGTIGWSPYCRFCLQLSWQVPFLVVGVPALFAVRAFGA